MPLAREAFAAALKDAGLAEGDIDHAVVTGLHARATKAAASGLGVRDGVLAPDLLGLGREPRRGARRRGAVRRARARGAGPGHRRAVARRRRRCLRAADDAFVGRGAAGAGRGRRAVRGRAGGGGARRPLLRLVPDLAFAAAPRAAAPARPRAPGCADGAPLRGVEVRLRGEPVHRVRVPPHAPDAGLPQLPRHRPDAARAPGRRARHGRHVHHRPPGLLAVAAGDRRHHRLRRRRALPLRADRRPPRRAVHRRPGVHDVPARVDGPGRAQLLLEGPAAGRCGRRRGTDGAAERGE